MSIINSNIEPYTSKGLGNCAARISHSHRRHGKLGLQLGLRKNQKHPIMGETNVKTFRWDQRLQRCYITSRNGWVSLKGIVGRGEMSLQVRQRRGVES